METASKAETMKSVATFTLHTTIVETEIEVVTTYRSTGATQAAASSDRSAALRTASKTSTLTMSSSLSSQKSADVQLPSTLMSIPSTASTFSSNTLQTTLPAVAVSSSWRDPSSASTLSSFQSDAPMWTPSAPSANASSSAQSSASAQKHAIVGGLSGAIAGLVLVGVIVAFCLRRRIRRRAEYDYHESTTEKGFRPALSRKWTELTLKGTPREFWQPTQAEAPVSVDEDHHIIRMSTRHWPRPYAQGQGEGWRESQAPGTLRVVNPDSSRPSTPARVPSDSADSFLKKQRSALIAVIASASRSRADSQPTRYPTSPDPVPSITIDPALSRECIAPTARVPSFKSYPSVRSSAVIMQQPLDDPFLTPPEETAEPRTQQRPKRPSLAPVQHAASAATRTLSNFGSSLNPFRVTSNVTARTSSTRSSRLSKRGTGQFSNPFDLWVNKSPAPPANDRRRDSGAHWSLYSGT